MFVAVLSRKRRCPGRRVVDVEHVVDGLDHVTVAGAHALVGRLDGELVSAPCIALLVDQSLEPELERRVRLRLLPAVHRSAVADAARETAVDNAVVGIRACIVASARELVTGDSVRSRCEVSGQRTAGS
jgi:hypothetical protein